MWEPPPPTKNTNTKCQNQHNKGQPCRKELTNTGKARDNACLYIFYSRVYLPLPLLRPACVFASAASHAHARTHSYLMGDVVGDEDDLPALGVLRRPQRQHPGHHAHVVQPGGAVDLGLSRQQPMHGEQTRDGVSVVHRCGTVGEERHAGKDTAEKNGGRAKIFVREHVPKRHLKRLLAINTRRAVNSRLRMHTLSKPKINILSHAAPALPSSIYSFMGKYSETRENR